MKNKFIFVIFLILGLNAGCHEVTVGYLWLEDPGYNPDTLLVKQESSLNISAPSWGIWPNPTWDNMIESGYTPEQLEEWGIQPTFEGMGGEGEDYYRNKWDQPYVSTAIEGIEGTDQIYVSVKQITTDTGDAQKLKDCLIILQVCVSRIGGNSPPILFYIYITNSSNNLSKVTSGSVRKPGCGREV